MTFAQALSFAVIAGAVVAFVWGRFRYDLIALSALVIGIATGDVPYAHAFSGFTSDVVIIIGSALVISAAITRSGIIEALIRPVLTRLTTVQLQVPALAGGTALLSMITKNVGALAILMPTALRLGRTPGSSPSALLMPMSFMALLGGLVTLVGTSTNIIVSQVRSDTVGRPFQMFDFAPVGLGLTLIGFVFVSWGWRLLPVARKGRADLAEVLEQSTYSTEARIPDEWPATLATLADLNLTEDEIQATALIGRDGKRHPATQSAVLTPGLVLVLEGDDAALERLFARVPLMRARDASAIEKEVAHEEVRSIEAVVQPRSLLIGRSAGRTALQDAFGVKLLAIGRNRERVVERLRDVTLKAGDVLVLQAGERALPEVIAGLGLLPLAERDVKFGNRPQFYGPGLILGATIVLVALKLVPIAPAFFGAAVLMVATGCLSMREAYGALEPEVLVLIGALTPLSEAVRESGGTALLAHFLANGLTGFAPLLVLGTLMLVAMICSPFLHNAPTVLVLGPISVAMATQLHLSPDPFLMAVATGAGCDFLTPIGHQCNTLVMGPGGYRFADYWRLGLPLSVLVIALGTPLIALFWPLVPG